MEPNTSSISKKIWDAVKVAIFMIRKGLNKKKIFMDLNMMMKRGKIAGKALGNLMFHNHHHHHHHHNIHHFFTSRGGSSNNHPHDGPQEYEFSCSDTTPLYFPKKRKNHQKNIIAQQHYMPSPIQPMENNENINIEDVNNMLDMMLRNEEATSSSGGGGGEVGSESPLLPGLGFGRSPVVRQLRITDSPFPVQNSKEAKQLDQDAEDFINKFYYQLRQQNF